MLDLTRKVYTPRPGLTHIIQLWKSNTRMCRNRGTVANDIMTDLLVSIQIKLNNPFEQLGLQTEIHLLRHFPLQIRIRISLYNPVNRWSASRFGFNTFVKVPIVCKNKKRGTLITPSLPTLPYETRSFKKFSQ